MRIQRRGASGDVPPVDGPPEAEAPDAAAEVTPAAAAAPAPEDVGGVAARGIEERITEVARLLREGAIAPDEALEQLIDDVIAHMGGSLPIAGQAAALKEVLRRQASSDPYLASKVRRLGNRS